MSRRALVAAAVLATACQHYHRSTNAPGLVDVRQPPARLTRSAMELPGDPGERTLTVAGGGLIGLGGRSRGSTGFTEFGVEASVALGEREYSHNDHEPPFMLPRGIILAERATALTLGWSFLQGPLEDGGSSATTTGPIYLELESREGMGGGALGIAARPDRLAVGPQVDAWLGPMYLRSRYLFGGGFELGAGYLLKLPTSWVWSR